MPPGFGDGCTTGARFIAPDKAGIARILDAPDPSERLFWRDKALLEFAYASGVRVGELITVKVRDVDLQEGLALVFGKGSRERIVPLGRAALQALMVYLREIRPVLARNRGEGAVFLNARGTPLTPPVPMLGHVTSSYRSAVLGRGFVRR